VTTATRIRVVYGLLGALLIAAGIAFVLVRAHVGSADGGTLPQLEPPSAEAVAGYYLHELASDQRLRSPSSSCRFASAALTYTCSLGAVPKVGPHKGKRVCLVLRLAWRTGTMKKVSEKRVACTELLAASSSGYGPGSYLPEAL
jgi:hypothetical protein